VKVVAEALLMTYPNVKEDVGARFPFNHEGMA